jgi:hypothetical protein
MITEPFRLPETSHHMARLTIRDHEEVIQRYGELSVIKRRARTLSPSNRLDVELMSFWHEPTRYQGESVGAHSEGSTA